MVSRYGFSMVFGTMVVLMGVCPRAQAQWAVVDVGAITQLIEQYQTLKQQLTTAENVLSQAQAQYQAVTGGRGMQNLMSGTNRNYLPSNWSQVVAAINQASGGLNDLLPRRLALGGESAGLDGGSTHALSIAQKWA